MTVVNPLALTLESDLNLDIGPGLVFCTESSRKKFYGEKVLALVQCLKSDLILESEPEDLLLSPLTLAMPLTLILLIKPLPLTLKSDVISDIGPGLKSSTFNCN